MADLATGDAQPVFRLTYSSRATIDADDRKAALGAIFTTARRTNRRLGVTGALMVSDDTFVQTLEGSEGDVRELFARISEDSRHDEVTVVEATTVPARAFGRWAMAKVAEDGGPDIRLLSNARAGTIVAVTREDQSITTAQEAVLAHMRAALAQPVADE